MATAYTHSARLTASPWGRTTSEVLEFTEAARIYANGDTIDFLDFDLGVKTGHASVFLEPLDTNATPLLTLELQLYNGTTTKKLVSLTAAQVKAGGYYPVDEFEGVGFVTDAPKAGTVPYRLRVIVTAAPATAASGGIKVTWTGSKLLWKGEEVLVG